MYDFPEVRDSTNLLLAGLVDALASCGEVAKAETPDSPTHKE